MSWLADNFTPLWIVWFVALALFAITIGALIHLHKPGNSFRDTAGTNPFTVFGTMAFVTSLLVYLGFSSPTLADWWQSLAAAVAWHMGGTLVLEIGIILDARYGDTLGDRKVHILMAVLLLIGIAMSWSSTRDLIAGPVVMHGTASLEVEKWHRNRGGDAITANIDLTAPDGTSHTVDLAGWGANRAEDQFGACDPGSKVDVTILEHTGTILDVACK